MNRFLKGGSLYSIISALLLLGYGIYTGQFFSQPPLDEVDAVLMREFALINTLPDAQLIDFERHKKPQSMFIIKLVETVMKSVHFI